MVGCELEEFRSYYKEAGLPWGDLGETEESHVRADPSHLITWREDDRIIGHAIWHKSNTEEHTRGGNPRNSDDRRILHTLVEPGTEFAELHEVWLTRDHREKGYGKRFFEFFEEFISRRGHSILVYYADDSAAIAICRRRGYREAYGVMAGGRPVYVFCLSLKARGA